MQTVNWKKYLIVFLITAVIFVIAGWVSASLTSRKVASLQAIQNKIATDILSSETQYSLLSELSCQEIGEGNLSHELASLAERIAYSERNLNGNDEVTELRKYYTLLEIKDFLLAKRISDRCGKQIATVLYFYTTAENCGDCVKQGYALTSLREKYPSLRVYSFDYSLDLSAVTALKSIYKVDDRNLPAMIINGKLVTGFKTAEDIEKQFPELKKLLPKEDSETEN